MGTLTHIEVSWEYTPSYSLVTGKLAPSFVINYGSQSVTVSAGQAMKQNITVEAPTSSGLATTVSITVSAQNAAGTGPASAAVQGKTTTVPPTKQPTKQPTAAPPPTSAPKPTAKSTDSARTFRIDMGMTMEGV